MKTKRTPLKSTAAHIVFLIMALIATLLFNSYKVWWVFIDTTVHMNGFSQALLGIMVLITALLTVFTALKTYKVSALTRKGFSVLYGILAFLAFAFFIFTTVYSIDLIFGENAQVLSLYIRETLSKAIPLTLLSALAIFYPALNCKTKKAVCALVLIVAALWCINDFYPLSSYKITSTPMVIDNSEEYSVVFSTSDYGTGYIEYTYDGKDYKVYDQTAGRLNSDKKIHNISVPYEHLRNNTYKVGSTRVIDEFSYGSRLGKTVTSEEYTFSFNGSDDQTYLVISDWHTMLDEAYSAIGYLGDYDAVILLGDSAPGVDFEQNVITNTVEFGGAVSGGTKPVIYVRGNHETRGAYANDLPQVLGLNELYYTLDMGPYSFVVLDSGEDKDDSHHEYGGMTDYNSYRADMIKWLEGVEVENEKVIALSHSWQISDVEEDLSAKGWDEIDRIGTRLIMSGHTHNCRLIGESSDKEREFFAAHPGIIGYMDGGKNEKTYIASMLTLNADGFELKACDNSGNSVFQESFTW